MIGADRQIVEAARNGESSTFAVLVDRYRNAVHGIAYHYLGSFEDAEDAAQEAFVQAYLHLNRLRDPDRFVPWLRRITANVCAAKLRSRETHCVSLDDRVDFTFPRSCRGKMTERMAMREALATLSDRIRLTVILAYLDGYSRSEIADLLGIPVETVRSRLRLAKRALRKELLDMVGDTLRENQPDPAFTRRVVEGALRRGDESRRAHAIGKALERYDEALKALEEMADGESRRLKMDALWRKADAKRFGLRDEREERRRLREEALSIAESLDDREILADRLRDMAMCGDYPHDEAIDYYRRALDRYKELGNEFRLAETLMFMGSYLLSAGTVSEGRDAFRQALPLFERHGHHDYAVVCRGIEDLLIEIGEDRFADLKAWGSTCETIEAKDGVVRHAGQPGFAQPPSDPDPVLMWRLRLVGYAMFDLNLDGFLLDPSMRAGDSRSAEVHSYSYLPLRATMMVTSDSEPVETPAGIFEGCRVVAMVIEESGASDDAPEASKDLNRKACLGIRRGWYAPEVGLVQLWKRVATGAEALVQLREYDVQGGGCGYLPLAIGNRWDYVWIDPPVGFQHLDRYRVIHREDERWYLEHFGYLMNIKPDGGEG